MKRLALQNLLFLRSLRVIQSPDKILVATASNKENSEGSKGHTLKRRRENVLKFMNFKVFTGCVFRYCGVQNYSVSGFIIFELFTVISFQDWAGWGIFTVIPGNPRSTKGDSQHLEARPELQDWPRSELFTVKNSRTGPFSNYLGNSFELYSIFREFQGISSLGMPARGAANLTAGFPPSLAGDPLRSSFCRVSKSSFQGFILARFAHQYLFAVPTLCLNSPGEKRHININFLLWLKSR